MVGWYDICQSRIAGELSEEFRRILGRSRNLAVALAMPASAEQSGNALGTIDLRLAETAVSVTSPFRRVHSNGGLSLAPLSSTAAYGEQMKHVFPTLYVVAGMGTKA